MKAVAGGPKLCQCTADEHDLRRNRGKELNRETYMEEHVQGHAGMVYRAFISTLCRMLYRGAYTFAVLVVL